MGYLDDVDPATFDRVDYLTSRAADILARLRDTEFATQEGTLYPLLSKLRRAGLLDYQWVESEAGPPRKYYKLTDAGRTSFAAQQAEWAAFSQAVNDILGGAQ